ncbi:MAG: O-methyltransferase [Bacteroidales bacterium]
MRPWSLLRYLIEARTRYSVHSPFVYEFIEKVLRGRGDATWYRAAENTRRRMLRDHRTIPFEDFGTGGLRQRHYPIRLSTIARYSGRKKKEGRMLARLVAWTQPRHMLELGTSLGISSLYMASACPEAQFITLEGCKEVLEIARKNFLQAGFSSIQTLSGPFETTLPTLIAGGLRPDLVLFDGNHAHQPTLYYFHQLLPVIHADTVFVFDDIHWSAGMEKAWKEIAACPQVTLSVDIFSMGLVFFRSGIKKQHFILRF